MNPTSSARAIGAWRRAAVTVAAGLVALAACSSTPSSGAMPTTAGTVATTSPMSGPSDRDEPGYATALRPVLQDIVTSMAMPSALVLVRSSTFGDATFQFGTRELGTHEPPTTTDRDRIGSLTKTMTGTVILQLAEEGKLSLGDPISNYRPDVPNGDNITIAHLLDMRSGLYGYDLDPGFLHAVDDDPERIWSPDDLLAYGYAKPALFPPGTAYDYSNTNYILLGLVMEQVTGQTASELFKERLFDPLGMDDTTLPALDDTSLPTPYIHGYMFTSAEKGGSPDAALSPDQQQAAADGTLLPADWSHANPSWGWTAGSVISTADDLVAWARAVADGELLGADMQAQRDASLQPMDATQPDGVVYGSGMLRAGSYYGHAGLIFGYSSQFLRDPETDTTIVVLTGLTLSPEGGLPSAALIVPVVDELARTAATNSTTTATG